MNKEKTKILQEQAEAVTILNPNVQPIYADHIIQVAMEPSALKLVLGIRVNNQILNNSTVILPMNVVLGLKDALDGIFSNPELQKAIIESAEGTFKNLKNRFEEK